MPENIMFLPKNELIGRSGELKHLRALLDNRGSDYVYYIAHGGYGKTRLLEELQRIVKERGPAFRTTGIIDLYHTDTHSASDIEKAIVEGLDPEGKYFVAYRSKRKAYELLRERGADPGLLEKKRKELGQTLVDDWTKPALDFSKLVICFDTIELLQYESSVVEDSVGEFTVDTRVREWLLDKLPKLSNVLVAFAGRPKQGMEGEKKDHQRRLITDMQRAFGDRFVLRELPPLNLAETEALIDDLFKQVTLQTAQVSPTSSDVAEYIPAKYLKIVYQLTAGRPIYIHLIVDLLGGLKLPTGPILEMLERYIDLAETSEDDPRMKDARREFEDTVLNQVHNRAGELGGYISMIALMPKGVNAEILSRSLGPTIKEAKDTLSALAPLSFVKQYTALHGVQMLHGERLFLHDEMYQLLKCIPRLRISERHVAQGLIENHYDPEIEKLENELKETEHTYDDNDTAQRRVVLRERLQKLRVERLYYQMVRDPRLAYDEYKDLSDQANRHRWVGFGMRLLDEFLRFYNNPERRALFEASRISHEQVTRESTELWVERFYWWGQKKRCIALAEKVLGDPAMFSIREDDDAILGNIAARWADVKADLYGYDPEVVTKAEDYQRRIGDEPVLAEAQAALARLHTEIGYQLRKGGLLKRAAEHYVAGNTAFRRLGLYQDELAMLLNNLAYVYAMQGQFHLARPLAAEALGINEKLGNDYTTGLTLSTCAAIEVMRGNFDDAIAFGDEALKLFRDLQDPHGIVLAYRSLARAGRKKGKESIDKGRKLGDARSRLETAKGYLESALSEIDRNGLDDDKGAVYAELGRVLRELGKVTTRDGSTQKAEEHYHDSERYLTLALSVNQTQVERADILQDLGELQAVRTAYRNAKVSLRQVEETVGAAFLVKPGSPLPESMLPSEFFLPLGKAERLRGKIGFLEGQYEDALRHFVIAYYYFNRFSGETPDKGLMIELVYDDLAKLPIEIQRNLVTRTRKWAETEQFAADVIGFTDTLRYLTGM